MQKTNMKKKFSCHQLISYQPIMFKKIILIKIQDSLYMYLYYGQYLIIIIIIINYSSQNPLIICSFMIEEKKPSKKLPNSTRIQSFILPKDLQLSLKADLESRGINKGAIVLNFQQKDRDYLICNIKMHKKVNGQIFEKKIQYLKSLGLYRQAYENVEQSIINDDSLKKNIDLIQQKEKVFIYYQQANQSSSQQKMYNLILQSYQKAYVDTALNNLKPQINQMKKRFNIQSFSIDNDEVKLYCQNNYQDQKQQRYFLRDKKTRQVLQTILKKRQIQQLQESKIFSTLLSQHNLVTSFDELSRGSSKCKFRIVSKDLNADQNDLDQALNQIDSYIAEFKFQYEYHYLQMIRDEIEAKYALKIKYPNITFKIKSDKQTFSYKTTRKLYQKLRLEIQEIIMKSQQSQKTMSIQNSQLILTYEKYLLTKLIDKNSGRSLIQRIQEKGGEIKEKIIERQKFFKLKFRIDRKSLASPEQLLNQIKSEIEQMNNNSKNYNFNQQVTKRFQRKIQNSQKGLYINKHTQTLIQQSKSKNKFIIKGPIYNVRNFLQMAKEKSSQSRVNDQIKAQVLDYSQSPFSASADINSIASMKTVNVEINSFLIQDYFKSQKVIQIMQGNLRIQCMSSNIWIELIESPKKLIKATVSPPHNTQLLQDIKSKIQAIIEEKQGMLVKENITGQLAFFIGHERCNIEQKQYGILLQQEKSYYQNRPILSKGAFAFWQFMDNNKKFQPFQEFLQIQLEKIFLIFEDSRLSKNQQTYDNMKFDLQQHEGWHREIQIFSDGKMIQRNKKTGKQRSIRRIKVLNNQYIEKNWLKYIWEFQDDQNQLQQLGNVDNIYDKLQNWFSKNKQDELIYYSVQKQTYSLCKMKIQGQTDSMIQTNLATGKQRNVFRNITQEKQLVELKLQPYAEYRRFKKCSYTATGLKQKIDRFKEIMNLKLKEEMTIHRIQLNVQKNLDTKKLIEFQNYYQGVSVDISMINKGVVYLTGYNRRVYLKYFTQFLDQCVKSYIALNKQSTGNLFPAYWSPMREDQKEADVFYLSQNSTEYLKIKIKFQETMPKARIISIYRIQSKRLYKRFTYQKNLAIQNGSNGKTMFLFHGSTAKAKQIYNSEEGIDLRFSGDSNLWGKGVYFSTAASYSNLYSKRSQMNSSQQNQQLEMLYCEVLVGQTMTLQSNREMKQPPLKEGCQIERYDSVRGVSNGVEIYVVYTNSKSYPSYVINYVQ